MDKVRVALVGVGGISQIVRIPAIKKLEDVELVALCDIDETKVGFIADKYGVEKVYYDIQNLLMREELDGIFICTPNHLHFTMALAAIEKGIPALIEKPVTLNLDQVERLAEKSKESGVPLVIGMNNRFREDAVVLKDFMQKDEIGTPFYMKCGWLRRWDRKPDQAWMHDVRISGGGVMMDMGISLVDLALWLLDNPPIKTVQSFIYNVFSTTKAEDSAFAIIETEANTAITIEVAWRLHLERDLNYMHVFGKTGSAFMNPLRINKELHGKLVNVTPVGEKEHIDPFKTAFEKEISNFIQMIRGTESAITPIEEGIYLMKIMDAIYQSARQGKQIGFSISK
jgi:predicted dehydrogenase